MANKNLIRTSQRPPASVRRNSATDMPQGENETLIKRKKSYEIYHCQPTRNEGNFCVLMSKLVNELAFFRKNGKNCVNSALSDNFPEQFVIFMSYKTRWRQNDQKSEIILSTRLLKYSIRGREKNLYDKLSIQKYETTLLIFLFFIKIAYFTC